MSQKTLDAALAYAGAGWRVFPIRARGKAPAVKGWQTAATTDEPQLRAWFERGDYNVGLATGAASGVVVLDVDGPDGEAALDEMGFTRDTPTVVTAKGRHLYYAHPGSHVNNKVRVGPGLDIRADGGLVVAPPSVHESGTEYYWEVGPEAPLAPMPWNMLALAMQSGKAAGAGRDVVAEAIPQGMRNDTLFRHACAMRAQGFDRPEILAGTTRLNEAKCEPPMTEAEVAVIVDQAMRYPPGQANRQVAERTKRLQLMALDDSTTFYADEVEWDAMALDKDQASAFVNLPLSEDGLADRFLLLFGREFRYVVETDGWVAWAGSHWAPCTPGKVTRAARMIGRIAKKLYAAGLSEDGQSAMLAVVKAMETERGLTAVPRMAASKLTFETGAAQYDRDPLLIAALNGTYDLARGEFRPAEPTDLISRVCGTTYDPAAECPAWEAFVSEVMSGEEDRIRFLQEALGYGLTGDMSEQLFFMLIGDGANGKSTLMRVVEAAMGTYSAAIGFETFDASSHMQREASERLSRTMGVRLVSASEAEDERVLAEARVKRITGGDPISVRGMYQASMEFRPQFKVFLTLNAMPIVLTPDFAFRRRLVILEFKERFSGPRLDKHLEGRLMAELPGVLRWLVDGARRWHGGGGLVLPESVVLATEARAREADLVTQWISEECDVEEGAALGATEGWRAFNEWCRHGNHRLKTQNWFSRRLTQAGYPRGADRRVVYLGLRLKSEQFSFAGEPE